MNVTGNSTDVTTYFKLKLSATNLEATGLTITDLDLQYTRSGATPAAKVDATTLGAANSAHTDNAAFEIDATDQPGVYRVDWPDAAFAAGVKEVICTVKHASCFTEDLRVTIDAPVNVTSMASGVLTATAIASDAITAAKIAADFGTEVGTAVWASTSRTLSANTNLNDPTAAAIATAVWQDATAGDFTVASSIGKSLYTGNIVPGAAGGHFIAGTNAATTVNITGTITTVTNLTNLPAITANWLTAAGTAADFGAEVADAVWDEAIAGHAGAGSTGLALSAAGSAGDPWSTALPGAYGSGTAGKIIGDNLNATISSRMATYTQPTGFLAATFPTGTIANTTNITGGTITTVTTLTNLPSIPANWLTATGIAADAITAAKVAADVSAEILAAFLAGSPGPGPWTSESGALDANVVSIAANVITPEAISPGAIAEIQAGLIMASGTIGSTGNDTTHLHLTGLTYGDDEINNHLLVIYDVSATEYHARWITDWVDTGDLATVATLPFTPQSATDTYWLLPIRQDVTGISGLDAAGVRAAVGLATANLDTQLSGIQSDTDNIQTRIPAALVSGRMDASVGAMASGVLTDTAIAADALTAAKIADGAIDAATFASGALDAVWSTATRTITGGTITTYTGNTPQTGDAYAVVNSVVFGNNALYTLLNTIGGFVDTEVSAIKAKTDNLPASPAAVGSAMTLEDNAITAAKIASDAITAAKIADGAIDAATFAASAITAAATAADFGSEIADAVWDEALVGHAVAGSAGEALSDAGTAADPWSTLLPGAYGAGTAGFIIGTNLDAVITSRMATYVQPAGFLAATFPGGTIANTTNITAGTLTTVTNLTNLPSIPVGWLTASGIAADAITASKIADGAIDAATFAAGAIDAAAIAANAIGASELAADAVAEIADAVWDEVISGHLTATTTGAALNAAGSAGDPWTTVLPGAYGAGTAGFVIGTNLNATVSSRLASASYTTPLDAAGTRTAIGLAGANLDTQLGAIAGYIDTEVATITTQTTAASIRSAIGLATANLDAQLLTTDGLIGSQVSSIVDKTNGLIISQGLIGSTGNTTTTIHLPSLTHADDGLNEQLIVILDVSTSQYHPRWITDWVNATRLATVAALPFTPANGVDVVWVTSIRRDGTVDATSVRSALGMASANMDTQLSNIPDAVLAETVDGITVSKALEVLVAVLSGVAVPSGSTVAFKRRDGTTTSITITYGSTLGERTGSVIS